MYTSPFCPASKFGSRKFPPLILPRHKNSMTLKPILSHADCLLFGLLFAFCVRSVCQLAPPSLDPLVIPSPLLSSDSEGNDLP